MQIDALTFRRYSVRKIRGAPYTDFRQTQGIEPGNPNGILANLF
jgi:hypothetical protein